MTLAFHAWRDIVREAQVRRRQLLGRWRSPVIAHAFGAWKDEVCRWRQMRSRQAAILLRMHRRLETIVIEVWRRFAAAHLPMNHNAAALFSACLHPWRSHMYCKP